MDQSFEQNRLARAAQEYSVHGRNCGSCEHMSREAYERQTGRCHLGGFVVVTYASCARYEAKAVKEIGAAIETTVMPTPRAKS